MVSPLAKTMTFSLDEGGQFALCTNLTREGSRPHSFSQKDSFVSRFPLLSLILDVVNLFKAGVIRKKALAIPWVHWHLNGFYAISAFFVYHWRDSGTALPSLTTLSGRIFVFKFVQNTHPLPCSPRADAWLKATFEQVQPAEHTYSFFKKESSVSFGRFDMRALGVAN